MVSGSDRQPSESMLAWLVREGPRIGIERPPAELRAILVALFDQRSTTSPQRNLLLILDDDVAELSFDSRRDLALAGTRGLSTETDGYRLAFTSEIADVVLHIAPRQTGALTVRGQVLARPPRTSASIVVTVVEATGTPMTVYGDDLGRFVVVDMPRTARALSIQNASLRLVVRLPNGGNDR